MQKAHGFHQLTSCAYYHNNICFATFLSYGLDLYLRLLLLEPTANATVRCPSMSEPFKTFISSILLPYQHFFSSQLTLVRPPTFVPFSYKLESPGRRISFPGWYPPPLPSGRRFYNLPLLRSLSIFV